MKIPPSALLYDPFIWAVSAFLFYVLYQAICLLDKPWGYWAFGAACMTPVVQWAFHLGRKHERNQS